MDFDTAYQLVDSSVFAKTGRHLSDPEVTIFRGACLGLTYDQMAKQSRYTMNYLMRDVGPKFWKLLSEVFGEDVSKTNFRAVLDRHKRLLTQSNIHLEPDIFIISPSEGSEKGAQSQSWGWGEAPDVSIFYGRTEELATMQEWIMKENCRLIVIHGEGGIGKTSLAVRCAQEVQEEFQYVIWRSLNSAPPLKQLLAHLLLFFAQSQSQKFEFPEEIEQKIEQLIAYLRAYRCLIILDGAENIFQSGEPAGNYRKGYENYGDLIQQIGQQKHQSCVLVTSRETPEEIAHVVGDTLPVRAYKLAGLKPNEAKEIFQAKNLGDDDKWSKLINSYDGHPLKLKIAAPMIQELFNGKVSEFLKRNTLVFGQIGSLLDEQFDRLSSLEKSILYCLAIARQPITLEQLENLLSPPLFTRDVLESLSSLNRRSFMDKTEQQGKTYFRLQDVLIQYINEKLTKRVGEEIFALLKTPNFDKVEVLKNYNFSQNKTEIKDVKPNPVLLSIKETLLKSFKNAKRCYDQVAKLNAKLQDSSFMEVGYLPENFQALLALLQQE